jgi:reductive dehalogenase
MAEKRGVNRRDFLKLAGLTGVALPAINIVGNLAGCEYLASRDAYGGFVVRRATEANPPYQVDDSMYKRMNGRNMGFARVMWDTKGRMELIKTVMSILPKEEMAQLMAAMNPQKMAAMDSRDCPPLGGFGPMGVVALMNIKKKRPGRTHFDYAFGAGSWTVASTLGTMNESFMTEMPGMNYGDCPGLYSWEPLGGMGTFMSNLPKAGKFDPSEYDYNPQELTDMVKTVAKFYGASLVGVAELDERWFYSDDFVGSKKDAPILFEDVEAPIIRDDHTKVIPKSMKYVVALAFEMDYDGIKQNFCGCSDAAVGLGYSRMAFTAGSLAEFFRHLGYHAIPMGNDTSLSPPMAIDAGLGELGRNGLLFTPKYGPRVRLSKVITDFPLVPDRPISFGVTEFCEVCGKCADGCPSAAIPTGERSWEGGNISNNAGVYKWHVNGLKCLGAWMANGGGCSNCITVCPFNKPDSWLHEVTRAMIGARTGSIDEALLKLDDASGYGKALDPSAFWKNKKEFMHIKS